MSSVGRNTVYNLAGFAVPLVLFIATIPATIHLIGGARYGVLAVALLIYAGFGMLDFGLGRAATQRIAALRDADPAERRTMLTIALATNVGIGAVGAVLLAALAWYVFAYGMKLEPWLRREALAGVPLMALGLPVITTLGILSGALQGRERFFVTNRITIANSALFQLLPLAVAWLVGPQLWMLLAAAMAARLVAALLLWRECTREFGPIASGRAARPGEARALLGYGGWVTVSGLGGLAVAFADRFLIGAYLGPLAVTIYTVPMDATRRLTVIADSLANALFPRLAQADAAGARGLSASGRAMLCLIATPVVAAVVVGADPLFRLWLGADIGSRAAPLAQVLAIAAWSNMMAKLPYAQLQAQRRPHLVAVAQLVEIPLYVGGIYFALHRFGLAGVAWVALARTTLDAVLLSLLADRRIESSATLAITLAFLVGLAAAAWALGPLGWPAVFVGVPLIVLVSGGLSWILLPAAPRKGLVEGVRAFVAARGPARRV